MEFTQAFSEAALTFHAGAVAVLTIANHVAASLDG